jgi:hypothetical protein
MSIAPERPLIASARAELAEDLRELAWIADDQAGRANVDRGGRVLEELRGEAVADARALEAIALALTEGGGARALRLATARRAELVHAIRCRQAILAGALVAASWQSPSIRHVRCSQAGPAEGRVQAHRDDYARDRHPVGMSYERALAVTRSPSHAALLTSCGMSAVVVALAHLERDGALRHGVLLGASTYHETRDLVRRAAPHAICIEEHPDGAPRRGHRATAPVLRGARRRGDRGRNRRAGHRPDRGAPGGGAAGRLARGRRDRARRWLRRRSRWPRRTAAACGSSRSRV